MTNPLSIAASNDFPETSPKRGLTVAERLIQAHLKVNAAAQELAALKKEFAQSYDYGTYVEGEVTIRVTHNSKLNKEKAKQLFGDRDIYEPTVTAAKLKDALTGAEYAKLLTKGDPIVSVQL